ncbi:conserved hypothetical protein [Leptothrix cholodnii SP-6]|uniref:Uncharacterized protein n=1 Tax=Leptothrix cholodnii (strain ATCC 51168 / LMG 8142 / SP-6) TaxID=395495 RepID=B1XZ50_LEPCP|nr:conserved hypothetical protein [Leptothrix cholodnii SP-6]
MTFDAPSVCSSAEVSARHRAATPGTGLRLVTRWLGALSLTLPLLASAWELQGVKSLTVRPRDQAPIRIGSVTFEPRGDGRVAFRIELDHAQFTDHFLSMKEFKCLDGRVEIACHVPYPYAQPGTVAADDLAWLEHSLLFLYKLPTDFGAKLWNGLYFRFERSAQGLVGRPQAVDLNLISAPPAQLNIPPYRPALRDDIAPGARWIESVTIE